MLKSRDADRIVKFGYRQTKGRRGNTAHGRNELDEVHNDSRHGRASCLHQSPPGVQAVSSSLHCRGRGRTQPLRGFSFIAAGLKPHSEGASASIKPMNGEGGSMPIATRHLRALLGKMERLTTKPVLPSPLTGNSQHRWKLPPLPPGLASVLAEHPPAVGSGGACARSGSRGYPADFDALWPRWPKARLP